MNWSYFIRRPRSITLHSFALNFILGCMRGYVYETMGKITSPGFPEDYPNNVVCYWLIAPGLLEYRLVLAFDTFNTEDIDGKPNCT